MFKIPQSNFEHFAQIISKRIRFKLQHVVRLMHSSIENSNKIPKCTGDLDASDSKTRNPVNRYHSLIKKSFLRVLLKGVEKGLIKALGGKIIWIKPQEFF